MHYLRTANTHPDFIALTQQLDNELSSRYGTLQKQYDGHNVIAPIETAIVGYVGDEPIACGCFKCLNEVQVEIKRMFVAPPFRRKGYSYALLDALEAWAVSLGYAEAVLETGIGQPEAIALYTKMGYTIIPNYGVYVGMKNSVCMHKTLRKTDG